MNPIIRCTNLQIWLVGLCLFVMAFLCPLPASACTLWSASGDDWVEGGGSLIVKNRDWRPDHSQQIRLIRPQQGWQYIGLFSVGNNSPGLKGGINQQGLVAVSASASSIPKKERSAMPYTKGLLIEILTQCSSVDQALEHLDWFIGVQYIMLADKHKTAVIELAPNYDLSYKVTNNGVLYHTNHYIDEDLTKYNKKIGISSSTRLTRIEELLNKTPHPFTLDNFIAFSHDQNAGPDNSLWRTGSKPNYTRTMSSWIVALPPQSSPILYVRLADPNKKIVEYQWPTDDIFNGKVKLPK